MKIGNVELKNNLLFAPIAGFSEVGFRHLCAKFGAGLTYTELVSAKGIVFNNKGTEELLATTPIETPVAVQLFGSDPDYMYKAARDSRLDKFDIIDINMGCPVKKVFNNGDGSALMLNPCLIKEIVSAVKEGANRPVTVKMRAGIEMDMPLAVQCALSAQQGGADAVTIHPRYREQFYSGSANHEITKAVKDALDIPVIANGDIVDKSSLEKVKELTGADGYMIGRGALGNPWIFGELQDKSIDKNVSEAIYEHIDILKEFFCESTVANILKLHLCYYAKGKPYAKAVRVAIGKTKTLDDTYKVVKEYFEV